MPENMMNNDSSTLTLAQQVKAKAAEIGVNQSQLAKQFDVSPAIVSQWFQGEYKGDNARINGIAESWLAMQHQQVIAKKTEFVQPVFVETETSRRIKSVFMGAQVTSELVAVYGGPGTGKTKAIEDYIAKAKTNAWCITMSPATASAANCLDEICCELGMDDFVGRAAKMQRAIVQRLKDTRGFLAFDEAQHMSRDALEIIRSIYDKSKIGIALVGNHTVYSNLTGGKRKPEFAQLFSRVGQRIHIASPTVADAKAIIDAWEITDPESTARLLNAASKDGGLRGMVKTLRLAYASKNPDHDKPTSDEILAAWNHLAVEA